MVKDIGLINRMMNGINSIKNQATKTNVNQPMNNQTSFTNEELDILYNLIRDEHDELMNGDWEAVKKDISELHLLMHKVLKLQS